VAAGEPLIAGEVEAAPGILATEYVSRPYAPLSCARRA
jgi:hypothetical protein